MKSLKRAELCILLLFLSTSSTIFAGIFDGLFGGKSNKSGQSNYSRRSEVGLSIGPVAGFPGAGIAFDVAFQESRDLVFLLIFDYSKGFSKYGGFEDKWHPGLSIDFIHGIAPFISFSKGRNRFEFKVAFGVGVGAYIPFSKEDYFGLTFNVGALAYYQIDSGLLAYGELMYRPVLVFHDTVDYVNSLAAGAGFLFGI